MLTDDRFKAILQTLLEKSREDKVNWSGSIEDATVYVSFPERSRIMVRFRSPESEPDEVGVILGVGETVIASLVTVDGDEDYPLVKQLYDEAYRYLTGWDAAVAAIERELAKSDDIGISEVRLPSSIFPQH